MYCAPIFCLIFSRIFLLISGGHGITISTSTSKSTPINTTGVNALDLEQVVAFLEKVNRPGVKSIQSPDGNIIDCIPLHEQLALDHPALKNHKIQTVAPPRPTENKSTNYSTASMRSTTSQVWRSAGETCPEGTVPIRRTTVDDVHRATIHGGRCHYGTLDANGVDIETAVAYTTFNIGEEFNGAKASMGIWKPTVAMAGEYSASRISITGDSPDSANVIAIQAGWAVNDALFGDLEPRLFTYWTTDGYKSTGCFNTLCPGFVQVDGGIALGTTFKPISTLGGDQYDISVMLWKDRQKHDWWLTLDFGSEWVDVGYWPAELFANTSDHVIRVEWGGHVANSNPNGRHTATQMGSGLLAVRGYKWAALFRNLKVSRDGSTLVSPETVDSSATNDGCYTIDLSPTTSRVWETFFFYGGPGYGVTCL